MHLRIGNIFRPCQETFSGNIQETFLFMHKCIRKHSCKLLISIVNLERAMRFELTTFTLANLVGMSSLLYPSLHKLYKCQ